MASSTVGRTTMALVHRTLNRLAREERGDVPGWVFITPMTDGLPVRI
jgi:hypothetical protein